ncbi:hypothetical protein EJ06DRAFT_547961 [Trichodelitschia bisporula]|uniref:Fibronectin type-III domain-containing protein n=1 Tax=Trichodelitschia bisporula TaxID=703511 RepID=A0A6G1I043_9PEZI|nr:hypothetical protein EJ06DRAFT_547961 [Trichodelitschia bisporula]
MAQILSSEHPFFFSTPLLHHNHHFAASSADMWVAAFAFSWFSTAVVIAALSWLSVRAYQVLSKPSEELINLLGLDVPLAPTLSLAAIKADGVLLNWKAPDQKASGIRHHVQVNGVTLDGELPTHETSFAIVKLRPDSGFSIRLLAINSAGFHAESEVLRVRTKPTASHDYFYPQDEVEEEDFIPMIQSYRALVDTNPASVIPQGMHREHSNTAQPKQPRQGRRSLPPTQPSEPQDTQESAQEESLKELTEKLDKLRAEVDSCDQTIEREDDEFQINHSTLLEQFNELKQAVADKENTSKALKKQVVDLSNQNTTAQNRRVAAEKKLEQKLAEQQKLRDDAERWNREMSEIHAECKRLEFEQAKATQEAEEEIARLREEHCAETTAHRSLEESLKQSRTTIEDLKHETERLQGDDVPYTGYFTTAEEEEWSVKFSHLQHCYNAAFQELTQAKAIQQQASMKLEEWQQRRATNPHLFATTPPVYDAAPTRRQSQRRSRTLSLRGEASAQPNYDNASVPTYPNTTLSPPFASASPFFNINNGMTIPATINASAHDMDFAGAAPPTSPSVTGVLLPSGLLGDDTDTRFGPPNPSARSSPLNEPLLPGLGAPGLETYGPSSPISNPSRSPSTFASPRASTTHLPFSNPDSLIDADRRSVRSAASSMQTRGGSTTGTRFAGLFGFSRQRGKTFSDEGPTLGSLRPQESQSFPREAGDLDPIGTRRRGSHAGTWREQMHIVLRGSQPGTQSGAQPTAQPTSQTEHALEAPAQQPKRKWTVFGSKNDPWPPASMLERPSSPRPASMQSGEPAFGRAFADSRYGWATPGEIRGPLGVGAPDWGSGRGGGAWSRLPSRRPSVQYGSGSGQHGLDGAHEMEYEDEPRALQAPIGTRPVSSSQSSLRGGAGGSVTGMGRLNPAAPSFKMLFGAKGRGKGRGGEEEEVEGEEEEGLERTATAEGKESFMQKLTRKSSASMFAFPGFGKEKARRVEEGGEEGSGEKGSFESEKGAPSPLLGGPEGKDLFALHDTLQGPSHISSAQYLTEID